MKSARSFTLEVASEPARRNARTRPGLLPSSPVLDHMQGFLSIFTGVFILIMYLLGLLILSPGFVIRKLMKHRSAASESNISLAGDGSGTAIYTLMYRSQMTMMDAGGPDTLAPLLMKHKSVLGPVWGGRFCTDMYILLQRINFYLVKRILQEQIAPKRPTGGRCAYMQCRTCWFDDCVESFLRLHQGKQTNLVILGAGYDTRCYRLPHLQGTSTYEVDAPGTLAAKLKSLETAGINKGNTVFVSCDFITQDWLEQLDSSGFNRSYPTIIVWEGVTMYLPETVIRATLAKVVEMEKGSCIGFDYLNTTLVGNIAVQKQMKQVGEPLLFGLSKNEAEELIASEQLYMLDHLRFEELVERYVPKHYDGRPLGYVGDFGGLVLAGNFDM